MSEKSPWASKWEVVKDMSQGGQGQTREVRAIDGSVPRAVMKTILVGHDGDPQRRGRMNAEVASLKSMHSLGARVPQVHDDNMASLEDAATPLYFVMEYVEGQTLADYISAKGPRSLDEAIHLTQDICTTVMLGHDAGLLHRDLKPSNIVLTPEGLAVVVDYGLSFQATKEDPGLTVTHEQMGNTFLRLPEMNVDDGSRRDPRSDLTAVCGILYFLLSGRPPVQLEDQGNQPPHRRTTGMIREILKDDSRRSHVEVFLDKGFKVGIDRRFQSIHELRNQLEAIQVNAAMPARPPLELARDLESHVMQNHRATQLAQMQPTVGKIRHHITNSFTESLKGTDLVRVLRPSGKSPHRLPHGVDMLGDPCIVGIQLDNVNVRPATCFVVGARDLDLVLFRTFGTIANNGKTEFANAPVELCGIGSEFNESMKEVIKKCVDDTARELLRRLGSAVGIHLND